MNASTTIPRLTLTAAILVASTTGCTTPAQAQEAAKRDASKPATATQLNSVAAIDGLYQQELTDIERRRLERLAALAAGQAKGDANQTYDTYFRAAIAANLFAEAEPAANLVLRTKETSPAVLMLAYVVKIMAEAGRGAYEESLASLIAALDGPAGQGAAHPPELPVTARLTLLQAYFQRLTQSDQYAIARKAFAMVRDRANDPTVKAFATARLARLDLVGKPAPPINGNDVDGRPVKLADFRNDVVLVVFWASWCLPCAEEISHLETVAAAYRDRGLKIIGISLDSLQDGGKPPESVLLAVRRFLLEYNVSWPNLINGAGDQDHARAYAVEEIPANVLIGRDGNILSLDLAESNMDKIIARAVGR